jgi:hypothetical protein
MTDGYEAIYRDLLGQDGGATGTPGDARDERAPRLLPSIPA